ncbi:MAG: YXWGXW repeat-containing protein [Acidobacteria bacterium]|nr:YXWGXW repeat-containing protein [Acidobacteriota bacterium]
MQLLRKSRWMLLAFLLSLVPASSFAGVLISVNIAPPILPVYEQPPCPEPGWMWTPGYWAYGPEGYYWVPGSWVPAPYEGALWTPPYWGWSGGLYIFHPGYWGRHVGYYGGINYGFGYMGVGFAGGYWRGHDFLYNTAVVRVNNVHIRNVYVDRRIVERNTIVNERRVSFNGGHDGIRHDMRPEEREAMRDRHMSETSAQMHHMEAARNDRNFYARNNGGRPQTVAADRPMGFHGNDGNNRPQSFDNNRGPQARPDFQKRQEPARNMQLEQRNNDRPAFNNQRPQAPQRGFEQRPQPQQRGFEQQPRGNYQQPRGNAQPRNESRPAPQEHGGGGGGRPQHEDRGHH